MQLLDVLAAGLIIGAAAAFGYGALALARANDVEAIYMLVVGTVALRGGIRADPTRGDRVNGHPCILRWTMVAAFLVAGCHDDVARKTERSAEEKAALGGEIAARVGDDAIPVSLVRSVVVEQRATAADAVRRLIDDAVAANGARERGLDRRTPAAWNLTAARARFMADHIRDEARAKGPPTDDEVRELSKIHWREVDRPPAVRVVHALAKRPTDPAAVGKARALATEMRRALVDAKTPEEFLARAKAFPHPPGVEVIAEKLPPFTSDGTILDGQGAMVSPFGEASHAIRDLGDTSDVVETTFGFHVIRLVEKVPALQMPFETRRLAFVEEANAGRARDTLEPLLEELRRRHPVSTSDAAEELMRSVHGPDHP